MERGDPETGQRSTQLLLVGLSLVDDNKVISRCRDSAGSIVEYSPHSLHAELSCLRLCVVSTDAVCQSRQDLGSWQNLSHDRQRSADFEGSISQV